MTKNPNNLAWLDLEMTGLNPETDRIIEMAMIITDENLNIIDQSEVLVIHQPDEILNNMDAWNTATHARTGLTEKVRAATLTEAEAEAIMLAKISQWLPENTTPMCGNSIHQDRRFLVRYMPKFEAYFHYRNLDVSTLKELAKRWHPTLYRGFGKKCAHQALGDIIESIEEMKYYRENFLKLPENLAKNPSDKL